MAKNTANLPERVVGKSEIMPPGDNVDNLMAGFFFYQAVGIIVVVIISMILDYDPLDLPFQVWVITALINLAVFFQQTQTISINHAAVIMFLDKRKYGWGRVGHVWEGLVSGVPGDIIEYYEYRATPWEVVLPGKDPFEIYIGDSKVDDAGNKSDDNTAFSVSAKLSFMMQVSDPEIALTKPWDSLESGVVAIVASACRDVANREDGTGKIPEPSTIINEMKKFEIDVWNHLNDPTGDVPRKLEKLGVNILEPFSIKSLRPDEKIENAKEQIEVQESQTRAANQAHQGAMQRLDEMKSRDVNPTAAAFFDVVRQLGEEFFTGRKGGGKQ
jgi:hypothetical protein